jgi:hypothetical protein
MKEKTMAVNDTSLVGYWDMETLTGGGLLKDLSGYGNNGIISGVNLPRLSTGKN